MRGFFFAQTLFTLIMVVLTLGNSVFGQTVYSLTDLGDLPGGSDYSIARRINDGGYVVGWSAGALDDHACMWDSAGAMTDLGVDAGFTDFSRAQGINNNGQVVGFCDSRSPLGWISFLWDSVNGMSDIGIHVTTESRAYAINDSGQVVGHINVGSGIGSAYLWEGGSWLELGDLPGGNEISYAVDINNGGQVVGGSGAATGLRAYLWEDGVGMIDLGDLPGGDDFSTAYGINNSGQVVGYSGATTGDRAFLWESGVGMIDLGDLGTYSRANAINDNGRVVGYSINASAEWRAFIWDSAGGIIDLNNLLDETGIGWTLVEAYDINSVGQIVGYGMHPNGNFRAFLLTPTASIPEIVPASYTPTRGSYVSGSVTDLAESDNSDLTFRRASFDIQSRTEFEVKAISPVAVPVSLEVTLEGAVFARSGVDQTIELFDYIAGEWEHLDTRTAARFTDSTISVAATGDLSRFVETGTLCIEARIRYQSANPRQQFSSNTDQFIWTIGQ